MTVTLNPVQNHIQPVQNANTQAVAPITTPEPQGTGLAQGDQLTTHTVKKGDTLWAIAGKHLGDSNKWGLIFAQNQNKINNPDLIYPGQVLTIPTAAVPAPPVPPQPAQPEPPAQEIPIPAEPVAPPVPTQPEPPAQEIPIPAEPVAPPQPAQPAQPVQEIPIPAQPAPAPAQPPLVLQPAKGDKVLRAAVIGGNIGAIGTAGTLIAMTARLSGPAANLGGYATAQKIASGLASVGLKVPQGPALTKMISSVGGPKVAGAAAAVGVGLLVAGAAAGGYYLYTKMNEGK